MHNLYLNNFNASLGSITGALRDTKGLYFSFSLLLSASLGLSLSLYLSFSASLTLYLSHSLSLSLSVSLSVFLCVYLYNAQHRYASIPIHSLPRLPSLSPYPCAASIVWFDDPAAVVRRRLCLCCWHFSSFDGVSLFVHIRGGPPSLEGTIPTDRCGTAPTTPAPLRRGRIRGPLIIDLCLDGGRKEHGRNVYWSLGVLLHPPLEPPLWVVFRNHETSAPLSG